MKIRPYGFVLALAVMIGCGAVQHMMGKNPQNDDEYQTAALKKCYPSCFTLPKPKVREAKVGCGYQLALINYKRVGNSFSDSGSFELASMGTPHPMKDCTFPAQDPDWAPVLKQAEKKGRARGIVHDGDVLATVAGADWAMMEDQSQNVVSRALYFNLYSKQTKFDGDKCGGDDPTWVCEHDSKSVLAYNIIAYRLKEAKAYKASDDAKCRIAAWHLVVVAGQIEAMRTRGKRDKTWNEGLTYMTVDGNLAEDDLFAKLEQRAKEGGELWAACGGQGEPASQYSTVLDRDAYYR